MAHPYTGNAGASFSVASTLPDDGDFDTASSVNVPFEEILDDLAIIGPKVLAGQFAVKFVDISNHGTVASSPTPWTLAFAPSENFSLAFESGLQVNDVLVIWAGVDIVAPTSGPYRLKTRIAVSTDSTTGFDGTWADAGDSQIDAVVPQLTAGSGFQRRAHMGFYKMATGQTQVFFALQGDGSTTNFNPNPLSHWNAVVAILRPIA